jgi:hypothetical protein
MESKAPPARPKSWHWRDQGICPGDSPSGGSVQAPSNSPIRCTEPHTLSRQAAASAAGTKQTVKHLDEEKALCSEPDLKGAGAKMPDARHFTDIEDITARGRRPNSDTWIPR